MKKQVSKQKKYIPSEIESYWQKRWKEEGLYKFDPSTSLRTSGKYYNLVELPYPSGDLHLGHWFAFVPPDAHARYMRMKGKEVFFPNGFDAFGLPAENAAILRGIHPKDWTYKNIETMRTQFETMGTMIDWKHSAITSEPSYYRWNQWIFLKMFEKGIAYRGKALSNWCPKDQTVLANEHIENGRCWRCGTLVVQKEVEQWFLAITKYADDLLWDNTDQKISNGVDWPKQVREGQNNWIGRSEGARIQFTIDNLQLTKDKPVNGQMSNVKGQYIEVFTTRPETTDGATFIVVAPEHELVTLLLNSKSETRNPKLEEVRKYVEEAKKKTELERKEDRTKSGVFSGLYATNPVTKKEIPVWISDYVLAGYGTGAIMAVPDADARDMEFAKKFDIPIVKTTFAAKPEGIKQVNYHLRDWSISRQRYWGTPVPIIYCRKCWERKAKNEKRKAEYGREFVEIDGEKYAMNTVPYEDLPVELPYEVDYTPKGKPPLASAEKWLKVKCPRCGNDAKRDAETLDTFFDSAWYYYRYVSPEFEKGPFDSSLVKQIMPVDIYFGGSEHTLGHTLYARFFTKFFKEIGLVEFDEFAAKRSQHGVILGPDGARMSKSRGNVVNPDEVVKKFGADTVRLYLCFMMPYEATAPWSGGAISGVFRFLKRVWELNDKLEIRNSKSEISNEDEFQMHKTIKKVGDDLESIHFNTAVAALMEWLNFLTGERVKGKEKSVSAEEYETFLKLLAPFAPHITEELWDRLSHVWGPVSLHPHPTSSSASRRTAGARRGSPALATPHSIHQESWPVYDESKIVEEEITIAVQVNGKLRSQLTIDNLQLTNKELVEEKARKDPKVSKYLEGKEVKKVIYVPGKIVNFVVDKN